MNTPEIRNIMHCKAHGIQCDTGRVRPSGVICDAVTEVEWVSVVALVAATVTTSVTSLDLISVGKPH